MDILSILDAVQKAGEMGRAVSNQINEINLPGQQMMEDARGGMAKFFGDTKTMIDEGDASEYEVIDQKAFNDRMGNIAKASAGLAQMPEMKPGVLSPQVISSPAPMGQAPNPYAPVNYGTMPFEGGIGRAPSMEEILKALQSRGQ